MLKISNKQRWFLIKQLANRDKKRENSSSYLGQLWEILTPFISMLILVIVFSTLFVNKNFYNYPLYILTGTTIYELFSFGSKNCMNSLVFNKTFLIKTSIEKDIFPKVKMLVAIINYLYGMIIYALMSIYFGIHISWTILLLPLDILLLIIMTYGIGKILAVIYVFFADIKYFYQIFTLFVFYGSAIFYDPSHLSVSAQNVLSINPIYVSIAIARILILDAKLPTAGLWIKLIIYTIFFAILGKIIFDKGTENIVEKL